MNSLFFITITTLALVSLVQCQNDTMSRAESLAWNAPKWLKQKYPYFVSGFDEDGTPVNVYEHGHWDIRDTIEKGSDSQEVKDFAKYTQQMYYRWVDSPNIFKAPKEDYIVVIDFDGYDNRQFTHAASVAFTLNMARQFVTAQKGIEHFKKAYLVNSNYLFSSVYQLIKPILGHLQTKVELYGTNKDKWIPEVRKNIPKDQLPEWLGGVANHKPVKVFG